MGAHLWLLHNDLWMYSSLWAISLYLAAAPTLSDKEIYPARTYFVLDATAVGEVAAPQSLCGVLRWASKAPDFVSLCNLQQRRNERDAELPTSKALTSLRVGSSFFESGCQHKLFQRYENEFAISGREKLKVVHALYSLSMSNSSRVDLITW